MSHPSLGLPHPATTAHDPAPAAADRLRAAKARLGVRALEVALESDPTLRERLGETGLRFLLRDTDVYLDRIALAVATGDPAPVRDWVDWVVPVYRRRRVSTDDVATLTEGLRAALPSVLTPDEMAGAGAALDDAIAVLKWHRRLGGDQHKRNALWNSLYRGA